MPNPDQVAQQCMDIINRKVKNLNKLNIIVLGKSGVGKSTLINSLFRQNFAEVGIGRPVTREIRRLERNDYPLVIYDTPGFELSSEQQRDVKDQVLRIINDGLLAQDLNKTIHCIWYCINVNSSRFEESEINWLRELTEETKNTRVPVIIVLTQSYFKNQADELKRLVERENLNIVKAIPVLAQDMENYHAFGLDTLVEIMSEALPNELQDTLQNIQKVSLESKKREAHKAVATAVIASVATCAVPIAFTETILLIPIQITMITSITAIFGMDISRGFLTGFVSSTLGAAGTTVLGRTVIPGLLKMIPGVGTAVGSVVSSTAAGLLTTALGETYIKVMEMIFLGEMKQEDLDSKEGKERIQNMFELELKKTR